ncbi:cation:proton antiporter [bacterium]|nr:cation:proton antiporter [bacterium]
MSDMFEFFLSIKHFLDQMNILFAVGLILLIGFLGSRIAHRFRLPTVSGYILVGLIIGPSVLKLIPGEMVSALTPVTNVALSLIALSIGSRLGIGGLRKLGKSIGYIASSAAMGAFLAVFILVGVLSFLWPELAGLPSRSEANFFINLITMALLLGAISSATAPAATVSVLNQYRCRGPLTSTLLAVVAIDDAIAVIIFGVVWTVCNVLMKSMGEISWFLMIIRPFWEIIASVSLGLVMGVGLHFLARRMRERNEFLIVTLGAAMITTGLAMMLHLSFLLANMAAGFILINMARRNYRLFTSINMVEVPIYVTFFVIAGANLHLGTLLKVGILGIVYILARIGGKIYGAKWGALKAGADETVRKYLGLGLIPQAGVAIGLVLLVQQSPAFASFKAAVTSIVLAGVAVSELIGPLLTKVAITRAGETHPRQGGAT